MSEAGLAGALTSRAIEAGAGERIVKRLDAAAAAESRDALAKTLYARLFDWLVAAVNRKIGSLGGWRAGAGRGLGWGGAGAPVYRARPQGQGLVHRLLLSPCAQLLSFE